MRFYKNKTLSATGAGEFSETLSPALITLNVVIQENVTDVTVQSAFQVAQDKVEAIKRALVKVGIPADRIRTPTFDLSPIYDQAGELIQGYSLKADLQADTPDAVQAAQAVHVVIRAGATSVHSSQKNDPRALPPSAESLVPAINRATEQAKALALVSAQAAGIELGSVQSLIVQEPQFTGRSSWHVQVTVTYNIVVSC